MPCDGGDRYLYIDDKPCDTVFIDDQEVDTLEIDGVCVWRKADDPGEIWFDVPGNYTWVTPRGYPEVYLCAVAGGGSGGSWDINSGCHGEKATGGNAGDPLPVPDGLESAS
jgi:hypothetical protein